VPTLRIGAQAVEAKRLLLSVTQVVDAWGDADAATQAAATGELRNVSRDSKRRFAAEQVVSVTEAKVAAGTLPATTLPRLARLVRGD
jgi:hypothetical protein